MTTPEERRELYLDAAEQTVEWNRAMREEERDAAGHDYDPREDANYPDTAALALAAKWDRDAGNAEQAARADW